MAKLPDIKVPTKVNFDDLDCEEIIIKEEESKEESEIERPLWVKSF